jgi:hypothetical protein
MRTVASRVVVLALFFVWPVCVRASLQRGDVVVISAYVSQLGGFFPRQAEVFRDGVFVERLDDPFGGWGPSALVSDRCGVYVAFNGVIQRFDCDGGDTLFAAMNEYPSSLVLDSADDLYASNVIDALVRLDVNGKVVRQYPEWRFPVFQSFNLDLEADQCTMLGRPDGAPAIKRIDACTGMPMSDFPTAMPAASQSGAFRILPDGGVLAANGDAVYRLSSSGDVLSRYKAGSDGGWTTVAIDPGGASFWAGSISRDFGSVLYQFDIVTGAVLRGPVLTGGIGVVSVSVIGEPRAAASISEIPATSTVGLLVLAMALVAVAILRL